MKSRFFHRGRATPKYFLVYLSEISRVFTHVNNYFNFQGLLAHGFAVRGAEAIIKDSDSLPATSGSGSSVDSRKFGSPGFLSSLVKPKRLPEIGTRLTRKFSRERSVNDQAKPKAGVKIQVDSAASESEPELPPEVTKDYARERITRYQK